MSDFEEKRQQLAAATDATRELVRQLFPVGAEITWRHPNSYNETGHVVGHGVEQRMGCVRVRDLRFGFHTTIDHDDILRATP